MSYTSKILILLIIILIIGGFLALITWDVSPEISQVEKTILLTKY